VKVRQFCGTMHTAFDPRPDHHGQLGVGDQVARPTFVPLEGFAAATRILAAGWASYIETS
jgi:hypothetical protein